MSVRLSSADKARYHWATERRGDTQMGAASETGIHGHMSGLLVFMEILSVVSVLAIFIFYFLLKRRIKKKKAGAAPQRKPVE